MEIILPFSRKARLGGNAQVHRQLDRPRDRVALAQDARCTEHRTAVLEFLYRKQAHPATEAA